MQPLRSLTQQGKLDIILNNNLTPHPSSTEVRDYSWSESKMTGSVRKAELVHQNRLLEKKISYNPKTKDTEQAKTQDEKR